MFNLPGAFFPPSELDVEPDDLKPAMDIVPGDIVNVATLHGRAVQADSSNFDAVASVRVLGEATGHELVYVMLVTDGDAMRILPTGRVNHSMLSTYYIEDRFLGEDVVFVAASQVRAVAKQQRGCYCSKCDEYNEAAELDDGGRYRCKSCRENPWR